MKKLSSAFIYILISVFILNISCSRDIAIDIPQVDTKLVVEGHIEQGQVGYVHITKNAPYFSDFDSTDLSRYIVQDAVVTLTDGSYIDTLHFVIDLNNYPYFPLVYKGTNLYGEVGKTYTLTVTEGNRTVTATTTIPHPVPLDSAWFKGEAARGDTLGFLWGHLTDPAAEQNFYRYMTKRLSHHADGSIKDPDFTTSFVSVFDDKVVNGLGFDYDIDRGRHPTTMATAPEDTNEERGFFKRGDTVVYKLCSIDKGQYDFWRTFELSAGSNGDPFATPVLIQSNVIGGFGIFGGYGASYDTVICR